MNHTEGPIKVQRAFGKTRFGAGESNDLLHFLRLNYPQFFEVHSAVIQEQQQLRLSKAREDTMTFDDMLASNY